MNEWMFIVNREACMYITALITYDLVCRAVLRHIFVAQHLPV